MFRSVPTTLAGYVIVPLVGGFDPYVEKSVAWPAWIRRKRLKKTSVRLARPSHVAMGRHHAVTRNEDPTNMIDDMISMTREIAPIVVARGIVAGILVADIWR